MFNGFIYYLYTSCYMTEFCGLCKRKAKWQGNLHKILIPPLNESDEFDQCDYTLCCENCKPRRCVLCDVVTIFKQRYTLCENMYACESCVHTLADKEMKHTGHVLFEVTQLVIDELLDIGRSDVSDRIKTRSAQVHNQKSP